MQESDLRRERTALRIVRVKPAREPRIVQAMTAAAITVAPAVTCLGGG
jgi:hypothetical protein